MKEKVGGGEGGVREVHEGEGGGRREGRGRCMKGEGGGRRGRGEGGA